VRAVSRCVLAWVGSGGAGGCSGPAGVPVRRARGLPGQARLRWLAPCAASLVRAVLEVRVLAWVGSGDAGGCSGPAGAPACGLRLPGQARLALARAMCSIARAGCLRWRSWPGWGRGCWRLQRAGGYWYRARGWPGFRCQARAALARAMCSSACAWPSRRCVFAWVGSGGAGGCSGPAGAAAGPAGFRASGPSAARALARATCSIALRGPSRGGAALAWVGLVGPGRLQRGLGRESPVRRARGLPVRALCCAGSRHVYLCLCVLSQGASWPGWGRGCWRLQRGRQGYRSGGLAGFRAASGPSAAALARTMCSSACAGRFEVRLGLGGVGGAGGFSGAGGVPVRRARRLTRPCFVLRWLAPCVVALARAVSRCVFAWVGSGVAGGCSGAGGTGPAGSRASGLPGQARLRWLAPCVAVLVRAVSTCILAWVGSGAPAAAASQYTAGLY